MLAYMLIPQHTVRPELFFPQ